MSARGCGPDDRGREPARRLHAAAAYAENTAAILYAKDHPNLAAHWWDVDRHGIQIGKITIHARTRSSGFRDIYDQLSQFAHPQSRALLASSSIKEGRTVQWSSAPHFKSSNDHLSPTPGSRSWRRPPTICSTSSPRSTSWATSGSRVWANRRPVLARGETHLTVRWHWAGAVVRASSQPGPRPPAVDTQAPAGARGDGFDLVDAQPEKAIRVPRVRGMATRVRCTRQRTHMPMSGRR